MPARHTDLPKNGPVSPSAAEQRLADYRDQFIRYDRQLGLMPNARARLRQTVRWTPFIAVIGGEPLFHQVAAALDADAMQRTPARRATPTQQDPSPSSARELGYAVRAVTLADVVAIRHSGPIDLVIIDPHEVGPLATLPPELVRPFKADDGRDPGVVMMTTRGVSIQAVNRCEALFGPCVNGVGAKTAFSLMLLREVIRDACGVRAGWYLAEAICRRCYVREVTDLFRLAGEIPDGERTDGRSPFVDALAVVCQHPRFIDSVDRLAAFARNMRWQVEPAPEGPFKVRPHHASADRRQLERLMRIIRLPPPGEFLDALRVMHAYWLLRVNLPGPPPSMHDVARRVGFIRGEPGHPPSTIPPQVPWERAPHRTSPRREQAPTTKTLLKVTRRLTGVPPERLRDLLTSDNALDFFGLLALRDVWQGDLVWLWEHGHIRSVL